jgi:hypothetical protein
LSREIAAPAVRAEIVAETLLSACDMPALAPFVVLSTRGKFVAGATEEAWERLQLKTCPNYLDVQRKRSRSGAPEWRRIEWRECGYADKKVLTFEAFAYCQDPTPFVVYDFLIKDGVPAHLARSLSRPICDFDPAASRGPP